MKLNYIAFLAGALLTLMAARVDVVLKIGWAQAAAIHDVRQGARRSSDQSGQKAARPQKTRYLVVPIVGRIGEEVFPSVVQETIRHAQKRGIEHVVVHIDTPGGGVGDARAIASMISNAPDEIRFTAYVEKAVSEGIWVMFACDEVFVSPDVFIGGVVPNSVAGATGQVDDDNRVIGIGEIGQKIGVEGWTQLSRFGEARMAKARRAFLAREKRKAELASLFPRLAQRIEGYVQYAETNDPHQFNYDFDIQTKNFSAKGQSDWKRRSRSAQQAWKNVEALCMKLKKLLREGVELGLQTEGTISLNLDDMIIRARQEWSKLRREYNKVRKW